MKSAKICERGRHLIEALCKYYFEEKYASTAGCHISVALKDQLILKIVLR